MGNSKGFSHLLFLITISFLILTAGVATVFGLLGTNRPVPQRVICIAEPENPQCQRSRTVNIWTLAPAEVKETDVIFFFSPSSNGNIKLQIINSPDNGKTVFESGLVVAGASSVIWKNVAKGSYNAVLVDGVNPVSNTVSFSR